MAQDRHDGPMNGVHTTLEKRPQSSKCLPQPPRYQPVKNNTKDAALLMVVLFLPQLMDQGLGLRPKGVTC